ncbi:MAG: folate-binding protein [Cyanobacteria bacterium P01_H01_bin.130]
MADSLSPLQQLQQAQGAVLDSAIAPVPIHYNNGGADGAIAEALAQGAVLVDRSHWTRLQFTGADRLAFLHNQTTQSFNTRQPGQGCLTTIVTATARMIDLALATIGEESVTLLTSPAMGDRLMAWFDRYIFPMDQVAVTDCSDETVTLTLLGPKAPTFLETLGFTALDALAPCAHQTATIAGASVQAIAYSGLGRSGYTLWAPREYAATLWERLTALGAVPAGENDWETWRIEDGVPKPGSELTDDYNPLEAGLWQAVSIDKGCYIGQETIARLNTYNGVKQHLYGLELTAPIAPGTKLSTVDGEKAGMLTSCRVTPDGVLGLAYIRRKVCAIGAAVKPTNPDVGKGTGTVRDVPFPVRANTADE